METEGKNCNYCGNENESATLFWNDGVLCGDELTHEKTKKYTCLCEDCKYTLESGAHQYIVWVGGTPNYFDNLLDAEIEQLYWIKKGYADVILEKIKE